MVTGNNCKMRAKTQFDSGVGPLKSRQIYQHTQTGPDGVQTGVAPTRGQTAKVDGGMLGSNGVSQKHSWTLPG